MGGKERDGGRERGREKMVKGGIEGVIKGRRYDYLDVSFPRRTGQHVPERVSSPTSDGGKHRVKRTIALNPPPGKSAIWQFINTM